MCVMHVFRRLRAWSRLSVQNQKQPIIKPSLIRKAGSGLFATRSYEKGEYVAKYGGRLLMHLYQQQKYIGL